jgi:hypothetical protein
VQRNVQIAAVATLGAAMVAATLIVGLGRDGSDGDDHSNDAAVKLDRPSVAVSNAAPSRAAVTPPAAKKAGSPTSIDTQRQSAARVTVVNSGSLSMDKHTMKIVSAHGDLTGQRELAWAADAGHAAGAARCTQNFRFNPQSKAGGRPSMLLCWRTSATKSVYTLAVDITQKPSERASVATLNATWNAMS